MKRLLYFYTGTGNSLWVARLLAQELNDITLVKTQDELDAIIDQKIQQAKRQNERPTKEQILQNSFIGYVNDIKDKMKEMEECNVKRMVIQVYGSPSIKDPLQLFHDKIMR